MTHCPNISIPLDALHEISPFPYSLEEIKELAGQITDPSFRIQNSARRLHIFNRDGMHSATDPFDLFPKLHVEMTAVMLFI